MSLVPIVYEFTHALRYTKAVNVEGNPFILIEAGTAPGTGTVLLETTAPNFLQIKVKTWAAGNTGTVVQPPTLTSGTPVEFVGTINLGGTDWPVVETSAGGEAFVLATEPITDLVPLLSPLPTPSVNSFTTCFAEGTLVATPKGEVAVETIRVGDLVLTADRRAVPVKWVGTHATPKIIAALGHAALVRIRKGALAPNVPCRDLRVTPDHGMILDGLVINAGALINGSSIDLVPPQDLPDMVRIYHVETEHHDVILANDAPSETYIDYASRAGFQNFAEYQGMYGAEQTVVEMPLPRISSRRLLPKAIAQRLEGWAALPQVDPATGLARKRRVVATS